MHLDHLRERAINSGDWDAAKKLNKNDLMSLLSAKIDSVSFARVREDIIKFIPDANVLDIWSPKYFLDLADNIRL